MSTLWLILIPLLVTWLPVGYIASRIWLALPWEESEKWQWKRSFRTKDGPAWFGLGVVFGWITLLAFTFILVVGGATLWMQNRFRDLGRLLAPRPRQDRS